MQTFAWFSSRPPYGIVSLCLAPTLVNELLTRSAVFAVAEDEALQKKIIKTLLNQNSEAKKRRVPKDSVRASLCLLVLACVICKVHIELLIMLYTFCAGMMDPLGGLLQNTHVLVIPPASGRTLYLWPKPMVLPTPNGSSLRRKMWL